MDLTIASPCHEDWERMTPAQRGRHCAVCDKTVVDIASLPIAAATDTLAEVGRRVAAGERVCVRCETDAGGQLRRSAPRRYLLSNGLAALLAMTAAGDLANAGEAAAGEQPTPQPPREVLLGKPVAPPQRDLGDARVAPPVAVTHAASATTIAAVGATLVATRAGGEAWRVACGVRVQRIALDGDIVVAVLSDGSARRFAVADGRVANDAHVAKGPVAITGEPVAVHPPGPPVPPIPAPIGEAPADAGAPALRCSPGGVDIWRSQGGRVLWRARSGGAITSVREDGIIAVVERADGVSERYDLGSGKLIEVRRPAGDDATAQQRRTEAELALRAEQAERDAKIRAAIEAKRRAQAAAQAAAQRNMDPKTLVAGAVPEPVIDAASGITVRADGSTLIATRAGAELWRVDVVAALGRPSVGSAAIRSLELVGDEVNFTYGKHRAGAAFLASGALRLLGED